MLSPTRLGRRFLKPSWLFEDYSSMGEGEREININNFIAQMHLVVALSNLLYLIVGNIQRIHLLYNHQLRDFSCDEVKCVQDKFRKLGSKRRHRKRVNDNRSDGAYRVVQLDTLRNWDRRHFVLECCVILIKHEFSQIFHGYVESVNNKGTQGEDECLWLHNLIRTYDFVMR